jgi:glycerol-3-phosphate O-acyltransferase
MGSQVTLPLWAVIILALLAAWAAIDRILVPSVRWALRRRANSREVSRTKTFIPPVSLPPSMARGEVW